jgi:predicted nucleotide-binding protein (sugar kinase/HSP70/actin superfamily)
MDEACGVVSIGPFACMPSRLAESILRKEMTLAGKIKSSNNRSAKKYPEGITTLPYLYIETDGNAFPQLIQSKIEIFMLQAERMNNKLSDLRLRHL